MFDLVQVVGNICAGAVGAVVSYWFIRLQDDAARDRYAQLQKLDEKLEAPSAPELLAALRKTLAVAVEFHAQGKACPDCPPDHEDTGQDCPMLESAEALIDRAEGRS